MIRIMGGVNYWKDYCFRIALECWNRSAELCLGCWRDLLGPLELCLKLL